MAHDEVQNTCLPAGSQNNSNSAAEAPDGSHALGEEDLERFGLLEAMLNQEAFDGVRTHAPQQLASAMLDDTAIASMHATAIDLSAALRSAGAHPGGPRAVRMPVHNAAAPCGYDASPTDMLRPSGSNAADGADESSEPHLKPQDFERGLADSYDAYRRACEHDRREMERSSTSGGRRSPSTQPGHDVHANDCASSERANEANARRHSPESQDLHRGRRENQQQEVDAGHDGEPPWTQSPGQQQAGAESGDLQRDELYPAGRILHLLPVDLLPDGLPASAHSRQGSAGKDETTSLLGEDHSRMHAASAAAGRWADASDGYGSSAPQQAHDKAQRNADGGNASVPVGGVAAPPPAYIAVDEVPQEAYNRIALCQTMLADHFLSKYIAAMDALLVSYDPL